MAQAAIRITPGMIDALKKKLMGTPEGDTPLTIDRAGIRPPFDNPAPQPAALSQSTIRAADNPVIDAPSINRNMAVPPNVSTIRPMQLSSQPNEFAAPSVQAAVRQNDDSVPRIAANPVASGQFVPPSLALIRPMAIPVPDASPADSGLKINRRVSPPLDQPSQSTVDSPQISLIRPNPQDAGIVPVADRRSAIEAASQSPSRIRPNQITYEGRGSMPTLDRSQIAPASSVSSPAPSPVVTPTTKPRGAPQFVSTGNHEKDVNDYVSKLENYKPENHNSRWKGIAASAGRMFLTALQGGNLVQAVGAAIFGGIYGAFDKSFDEKLAKQWNLSSAEQSQARDYAKRLQAAHLKSAEAEASINEQQAADYPDKLRRDAAAKRDAATARSRAELDRIVRSYYPKGLPPREELPVELINKAKELGYPLDLIPEKPPYSPPALGSPQNRPFAITPGQVVLVPDGKGGMKQVPTTDGQGNPLPTMTDFQKGDLQAQTTRNNQFAGRGARRLSGRSSAGRGDSIGENLKTRDAARYQSEKAQAEASAVAAEQRGDDATATAYRNAARVAQQNIDNLRGGTPARGGRSTRSTPKRGDPLGILD